MDNTLSIEERIDAVLEKLRPFLQREGGNIKLDHFDAETGICYVDMIGACAGCSMASVDVSESVEVLVLDEVPEVKKVELVTPSVEQSFDDLLHMLAQQQEAEEELRRENEKRAKDATGPAQGK